MLAVHHNCSASREFAHVDAMASSLEAQFDAAMDQAFSPHAIAHARFVQQVHRSLFKNTGADPLLDVLSALRLDNDGVDAREMKQVGEDEACWSGADNADLCAKCSGSCHVRSHDLIDG